MIGALWWDILWINEWMENYQTRIQCSRVLAKKNDVQHVGVSIMLKLKIDAHAKLLPEMLRSW